MPSSEYWKKRQVWDAYEIYREAEDVAEDIAKLYRRASGYIEEQAEMIFQRFRMKYGLTEQEAYQLINTMRDPGSTRELLQKLSSVQQNENVQELRMQLESAAYRSRLERLAGLQNDIDSVMEGIYRQEVKKNTDFYRKVAEEGYYKGIYRLQQRAGVRFPFTHIDHKVIDRMLRRNWSGAHYSRRIWGNTKRLANELKNELLVNLITGRTIREAAEVIRKIFNKGIKTAQRLVRTESNHIHSEMNAEAYEDASIGEYLYLATLDLRTSKICRSLDGKIFKVKDRQIGKNFPPMHPWCRSTTIAVINREWLKHMTRSARDPVTGKVIKVPMTMKYQEWYDKYVKGHEDEIENQSERKSRNLDLEQYERYRERGVAPETYEEFKEIKYNNPEEYEKLKNDYRSAGKSGGNLRKFTDDTKQWQENATNNESNIVDADKYVAPDGKEYFVDGVNVTLDYSAEEYQIGEILSRASGEDVFMCPRVSGKYKGVHTPDYILGKDKERWDLKTIRKNNKDAVRNAVHKNKGQAENFIINISGDTDKNLILELAEKSFEQSNMSFVDKMMIVQDGIILKVLKRQ